MGHVYVTVKLDDAATHSIYADRDTYDGTVFVGGQSHVSIQGSATALRHLADTLYEAVDQIAEAKAGLRPAARICPPRTPDVIR